jgi:predicted ribonuclease toxin of YeeF-YezG toxin-antitoxin module
MKISNQYINLFQSVTMEQFLLKQVRICICNSTWHRGEKDEKKNTNIEGRQTGKLHKKNRDTHNIGGKKNRGKEPEKKEGERENQRTEGPSGLPFRTLTRECLFSLKQRNAEPKEQRREQKH